MRVMFIQSDTGTLRKRESEIYFILSVTVKQIFFNFTTFVSDIRTPSRSSWDDEDSTPSRSKWEMPSPARSISEDMKSERR